MSSRAAATPVVGGLQSGLLIWVGIAFPRFRWGLKYGFEVVAFIDTPSTKKTMTFVGYLCYNFYTGLYNKNLEKCGFGCYDW